MAVQRPSAATRQPVILLRIDEVSIPAYHLGCVKRVVYAEFGCEDSVPPPLSECKPVLEQNSIIARFQSLTQRTPHAPFLTGEQTLTYAQVAEKVVARAEGFSREAGESALVLTAANTCDWVINFLAARQAGCVPFLGPAELSAHQQQELGELIGRFYLFDSSRQQGQVKNQQVQDRPLPQETGFGLLTSGTTGLPKVVLRSDASLLQEGQRYVDAISLVPGDCILAALPLSHAFALGVVVGGALASGCRFHLVSRFIPRTVAKLVQQGACTILPLVPASARLVCQVFPDTSERLPALRQVIIGAGPVSPALERLVMERLGLRPARNYGSSETGATLGTVGQDVPDDVTGAPLPGIEAAIMGDNENGSLFLRMRAPFLGYVTPHGLDYSRVSPDGWYSTGDVAYRDGDWITITGRLGEGLRRGGRFVQPAELENVLRRHPAVVEAVVIGRRDAYGEDVIEAHIELRAGVDGEVEELRRHTQAHVELYKIPTVWRFYRTLPRTLGGKPDRAGLMQGAG